MIRDILVLDWSATSDQTPIVRRQIAIPYMYPVLAIEAVYYRENGKFLQSYYFRTRLLSFDNLFQ